MSRWDPSGDGSGRPATGWSWLFRRFFQVSVSGLPTCARPALSSPGRIAINSLGPQPGKENESWRGGRGLPAASNKAGAGEKRWPWDRLPQLRVRLARSQRSARDSGVTRAGRTPGRRRGGSGAPGAGGADAAVPALVLKGGGPGGAAAGPGADQRACARAQCACARVHPGVMPGLGWTRKARAHGG